MKTGLIYKLTSKTSKKSYIGKSMEYRFETRIADHSQDFSDTHLGRAKKKYGWNDFEIEIIEKGIPKEKMSEREIYWIEYYDTFHNGYNSTRGGEGGNTYAKVSKEKMEEIKRKISKKNSGKNNGNKGQYIGEKNSMYGKHHSNESKEKISKSLKGRKKPSTHGENVSKATKGKTKNYICCHKWLQIFDIKKSSFQKMKAKEIVSFLKIENYIELKNIIYNKIEVNGYLVVESVETIETVTSTLIDGRTE